MLRWRLLLVLVDLLVQPLDETLPVEGRARHLQLLLGIVRRDATTA